MFKRKGKIVVCATVFVFMLCSSLFAGGVQDSFEELNNSVNELIGGSGSKKEEPKTNSQNTSSQNNETAPVEKAEPAKPAEPVLVVKEMVLPTEPNSEDDFDVTITEDGQGAKVIGYKGKSGGVYIPATIQGLPVKEVEFEITATEPTYVNALVVSEGCEEIFIYGTYKWRTSSQDDGYKYNSDEKYYELYVDGELVERINPKGFELGLISLPDSIVAFSLRRTAITEFEVPANVKTVGRLPGTLEKVSFRGVPEIIGRYAFAGSEISSIELPEGVKEIKGGAFEGCEKLKSVSLPNSLISIEGERYYGRDYDENQTGAFYGCISLESITIPGGVEMIEANIFSGCESLKTVVISEGVKIIGHGAFDKLTALESVSLPSTLEEVEYNYFDNTSYDPRATSAFYQCTNLKELVIPEGLTQLKFHMNVVSRSPLIEKMNTFEGCSKLPLGTQARLKKLGYTGSF